MIKKILFGLFLLIIIAFGVRVLMERASFEPAKLYAVMPENHVYMSVHENLGRRLPSLIRNEVVQLFLEAAGTDIEALEEELVRPGMGLLLSQIIGRLTVFSYAEETSGKGATYFSTWIGSKSKSFTKVFNGAGIPLQADGEIGGVEIFRSLEPQGIAGEYYWICATDGLLMGVFSFEREAMVSMVSALQKLPEKLEKPELDWLDEKEDYGWFVIPGKEPERISFRTSEENRKHGRIEIKIDEALSDESGLPESFLSKDLPALLGDAPMATMVLAREDVLSLTEPLQNTLWANFVNAVLSSDASGPLNISLFGGEFAAHVIFAKIPMLLITMQSEGTSEAWALMDKSLALLGKNMGLTFNTQEGMIAGYKVKYIEENTSPASRFMKGDLRLCYTVIDNLLILCSNARSFEKILSQYRLADGRKNIETRWQSFVDEETAKNGFAWFDLEETRDALSGAVGVIKLIQMGNSLQGGASSSNTDEKLIIFQNILDQLASLKSLAISRENLEAMSVITIDIGEI